MKARSGRRAKARLDRRRKAHGDASPDRKAPGSLNPHKTIAVRRKR